MFISSYKLQQYFKNILQCVLHARLGQPIADIQIKKTANIIVRNYQISCIKKYFHEDISDIYIYIYIHIYDVC